ncbi:site-specific integrase [Parasphingopyxis sp. CP4]|nr:site-specific integrase [Parasphingopyxis sp. CP4]
MAKGKITKKTVDRTRPGERDQFLWDTDVRGFGLKVTPAGKKVFVLQYRLGGRGARTKRVTIGPHGVWTPDQARQEAMQLSRLVDQGIDPAEAKRERERQQIELAFDAYADHFLEFYIRDNWKRSFAMAESALRLHVRPVLKSKPLPSIDKADVANILDRIPASKPAVRRQVFAVLRKLFNWAVGRGDLDRSPMDKMPAPPAPKSRDRVLDDGELCRVWKASDRISYPFGPLVRLLMITGQRLEEVAALDWSELDRTERQWIIPRERAKNENAVIVHLSDLAIVELDALADDEPWPKAGLVFTTTGDTPVSGFSKAKARLDRSIAEDCEPLKPWRNHDIRRTVATGFQRLGVRFEVTEAVLNHVSGSRSGVAGVYQRYDWASEKQAALEAWSNHLGKLVNGVDNSNVVSITARKRP